MLKKILKLLASMLLLLSVVILGFLFLNYTPDMSIGELEYNWAYPDSKFIDIDDMPVHYRITGEGHPLVLIHGTGASLHTWEAWTEILKDDFKIISLDLPAYGLTGPNKTGTYNLPYYSQFLNHFLEEIGIDTFHLAGNSLGGAISWQYTIDYPEKVRKLVLLDAAGYPSNKETPLVFKLAANKFFSKILLKITPKSIYKTSLLDVFENDELVSAEMINRYYELSLREGNRQAFVDRLRNRTISDITKISTIKAPTLILWGEKDNWISEENAWKFDKDIPDSEVIIYENVGHLPMEEVAERSAEDTRKFLLNQVKSN